MWTYIYYTRRSSDLVSSRCRVEGTNTFHLIKFGDIPQNRRKENFHCIVVCEVKPHKENPNRMSITVAGSKICNPGDVGTPTDSLELVKLIINSVLSRCNVRFVSIDLKKRLPPNPN